MNVTHLPPSERKSHLSEQRLQGSVLQLSVGSGFVLPTQITEDSRPQPLQEAMFWHHGPFIIDIWASWVCQIKQTGLNSVIVTVVKRNLNKLEILKGKIK